MAGADGAGMSESAPGRYLVQLDGGSEFQGTFRDAREAREEALRHHRAAPRPRVSAVWRLAWTPESDDTGGEALPEEKTGTGKCIGCGLALSGGEENDGRCRACDDRLHRDAAVGEVLCASLTGALRASRGMRVSAADVHTLAEAQSRASDELAARRGWGRGRIDGSMTGR